MGIPRPPPISIARREKGGALEIERVGTQSTRRRRWPLLKVTDVALLKSPAKESSRRADQKDPSLLGRTRPEAGRRLKKGGQRGGSEAEGATGIALPEWEKAGKRPPRNHSSRWS